MMGSMREQRSVAGSFAQTMTASVASMLSQSSTLSTSTLASIHSQLSSSQKLMLVRFRLLVV